MRMIYGLEGRSWSMDLPVCDWMIYINPKRRIYKIKLMPKAIKERSKIFTNFLFTRSPRLTTRASFIQAPSLPKSLKNAILKETKLRKQIC
jgi:hypothetical protein